VIESAASVSHDGEAIYGAQVVAAMEAQAFVESDLNKLLDTAVALIPQKSLIYQLIADLRNWHAGEKDWRKTREKIAAKYGYDKYGGNCHMVPNHALIVHALLHGEDDFQKSLMIVNTCGWDTDCNSGNVGCLLGIKNGLAGIDNGGPDWRGPVADRLYLSTAEGGRGISDAATETLHVVNVGRALAGAAPLAPKQGAYYHFELPGAVQGFQAEASSEVSGTVTVENVLGHSQTGQRSLALHYQGVAPGRSARVATPTFIPSKQVADYFSKRGYALFASPRLYPGQTVRATITADGQNGQSVQCNLYTRSYGSDDQLVITRSPAISLAPGGSHAFVWPIPGSGSDPIAEIGVEISHAQRADGTLYLDALTWDGAPSATFQRPAHPGEMWRQAWINGVDQYDHWWPEAFRLVQNEGRGLLSQGTRAWTDYEVSATITPHLAKAAGLAARVQGMRRGYALLLCDDQQVRLVKMLDGDTVLAARALPWQLGVPYNLQLQVNGNRLRASVDGVPLFDVQDNDRPLSDGAIALVIEEGRMATEAVTVGPAIE
jgi:hypothetical protein